MRLSLSDIAVFSLLRGAVLIGPRAAFGIRQEGILLRERADIARLFERMVIGENQGPALRREASRWGLDPAACIRHDRSIFARWLTDQTVRGLIGVALVPDPVFAFAGRCDQQQRTLEGVAAAASRPPEGDLLPPRIEERFALLVGMIPDRLAGTTKMEFLRLLQGMGLGAVAGGLLAWIGPPEDRGLNLAVLAFDLPSLSGDLFAAMDRIAQAIDRCRMARSRSALGPIAADLAGAIELLIVHRVLGRFLRARQPMRGYGRQAAGRATK